MSHNVEDKCIWAYVGIEGQAKIHVWISIIEMVIIWSTEPNICELLVQITSPNLAVQLMCKQTLLQSHNQ